MSEPASRSVHASDTAILSVLISGRFRIDLLASINVTIDS
jgi:hypothetical protein